VVVLGFGVGELAAMVFFFTDVELATEDRMEVLLLHGVEEMDGAEDVAVVGHGGGCLANFCEVFGELVDVAGAVEEGVIGVEMEMGEFCRHEGSLLLG
jgi:hypothetical protein